jgi:hypothetical protein
MNARAVPVGKPVGKEHHDAGIEPGLGQAQEEAHGHEAPRASAERGGAREQAPGHHDARNPEPRPDFFQDDVARHLEQDIAPEEGARRHAEGRGVEAQILVHGERGEADVDTVEIAEEIGEDGEGQQAQIDLAHGSLLDHRVHPSPPKRPAARRCVV